jgi:hypothetical protein
MQSQPEIELAGIQYSGLPGVTAACKDAVMRLIQFGDRVSAATILTCASTHCLLLTLNVDEQIAIKSGFGSGYGGEGPRGFSYVLQVLDTHGAEIDEREVSEEFIDRLDKSALTTADIDELETAPHPRRSRIADYVEERDWEDAQAGRIHRHFPPVMPFSVIDPRLMDLALKFFETPDANLLLGYRRLEDIVRGRIQSEAHGARLFSDAFIGVSAKLVWKGLSSGEQQGRASLFAATYNAYRNPRAHREISSQEDSQQLEEFLLLNHLFCLEKLAV